MTAPGDITRLLAGFERGDRQATERLANLVYAHLRRLAAAKLQNERTGHSFQPTMLVNDAILKLAGKRFSIKNRAHFFALAARCMRQILVDHARQRNAVKRGGGAEMIVWDENLEYSDEKPNQLLLLDGALTRLAIFDEQKARVVEMKYFGGMTNEEIARTLGVGITKVKEQYSFAIAWLRREFES
jgi:RNA polymerase sigma-70 factor (ECF subfamily)